MTKPIPEGYHTITPVLVLKDSRKAIDFYKKAFGATEKAAGSKAAGARWPSAVARPGIPQIRTCSH